MSDEIKDENVVSEEETDATLEAQTDEVIEEEKSETIAEDEETKSSQDEELEEKVEVKSSKKKAKKVLTPEQKKKKTIKGLIITAVVVLVIAIFFSSCAIVSAVGTSALIEQGSNYSQVEYTDHQQLVPVKDSDGYYTFVTDRDLKILQFTDVHIGGGAFSQTKDSWAMNAVATMIRAEQPDLVIITGDIAYPVPFQAGTFNNLNATKIFSNMMESLGVYWTFCFGNHDTELYSLYSRQAICDFYESANYKYCLFSKGSLYDEDDKNGSDKGFGNNIIKVKGTDGLVKQALVTFDSHSYVDGDYFGIAWKYDNIHQSQVDWYAAEMDKLQAANKAYAADHSLTYTDECVKNLTFFHIPLVEYREAWSQVMEAAEEKGLELSGACSKSDTITPVVINDDVTYYYGNVGESDGTKNGVRTYGVFCGCHSDELFETGLTHGMQGVFCGHDHYNNFSISYKGIRITYGRSIDYLAYAGIYKEHWQRGCTVITVGNDGSFTCNPTDYYLDYNTAYEAE